jgi:hypothetical protein
MEAGMPEDKETLHKLIKTVKSSPLAALKDILYNQGVTVY